MVGKTTTGNLLFEETFEQGAPFASAHGKEVGDWDYALQYVSSPVFKGTKACRFEIRQEQALVKDGKRAEVTVVGPVTSKERWYSFAVYFPAEGFAKDTAREIISQWYQRADKHLGEKSASPATALRINKDRFILDTGFNANLVSNGITPESKKRIDLGEVTKDTWHEFVFHFVHSFHEDGLIEVWHNGTKILTHNAGNMYNNAVMPKWKIGLYKAAFKSGTSAVAKRVVYFDNIRVGNEQATYQEMAPSSETVPAK
ncbi:hypothetical protein GCM10023183_19090 [Nibribacter koreensis]|uniref:Polysaccharide lyase n=2 Tax=Nibribacter koreensis TaxID=1084519 RepID=A0ABP8FJV3_9BACT